MSALPPAGWYPDPEVPSGQRYWDGSRWTRHRAPLTSPPPPTGPPLSPGAPTPPRARRRLPVILWVVAAILTLAVVGKGMSGIADLELSSGVSPAPLATTATEAAGPATSSPSPTKRAPSPTASPTAPRATAAVPLAPAVPERTSKPSPKPTPKPKPKPKPSPEPTACVIKGNIASDGERIYHVPGGQFYDVTKISVAKGERWFCSEADAVAAGWRKSKR